MSATDIALLIMSAGFLVAYWFERRAHGRTADALADARLDIIESSRALARREAIIRELQARHPLRRVK